MLAVPTSLTSRPTNNAVAWQETQMKVEVRSRNIRRIPNQRYYLNHDAVVVSPLLVLAVSFEEHHHSFRTAQNFILPLNKLGQELYYKHK